MASANIKIGPTIQFKKSDALNIFVCLNTSPSWLYFTFVNGGYIININPMAKGILVVPLEKERINFGAAGIRYPIETPAIIAKKIQRVKYLSKKLNFFLWWVGAQLLFVIFLFYS
jgi:hypothetical protein